MTILIVAGLICVVINLILSTIAFLKPSKITPRLNYTVAAFAFLTAIWCLFRTIALIQGLSEAIFWDRMSLAVALFCASTTPLISYAFSEKKLKFSQYMYLYLPAAFFSVVGFTPIGIKEIVSIFPLKKITGIGYTMALLWLTAVLIYVISIVTLQLKTLKGTRKLQLQYFLLGMIFYIVVAVILDGVFSVFNIHFFVPYVPLFSVVWVGTIVYSLSKQLMSLELLQYNALRLSLLLICGISLNVILMNLFESVFRIEKNISGGISIAIIILLYSFLPLRARVKEALETLMLKKRVKYQNLLTEVSNAVVSILDIDELLEFVVDSIHNTLGIEKIGIFIAEKIDTEKKFKLHASRNLGELKSQYFSAKKVIEYIETHKQPFIVDTTMWNFPGSEHKEILQELSNFGAVLIIPLIFKNDLLGLITVDQKKIDGTVFDIQDIEILQTLSNNLAVAIRNAKLYKDVEDAYFNITRALAVALEAKNIYSVGHSDSVTKYSVAIAKQLNLSPEDIVVITQAAMLHDLGKIGIHDYVLAKEEKLTQEEWEEIKLHSLKGVEILKPLPFLKEVSEIIKHHHEHYDGTGYPDKLKEEEIPLGAQILSVADAFDAMITDRPYRKPKTKLTVEEAIAELKKNSGTQFNPKIVEIFLKIIKENPNIVLSQRISSV